MPFGLKNAPAYFQKTMNTIFAGLIWKMCLLYMNNLLVFSKTFREYIIVLQKVFVRACESNLKLHGLKCELFLKQLEFFRHEVSTEGIHTSSKKTEAIRKIAVPDNAKKTHTFVGLASFYHKFIKNFVEIARPLYKAINQVDKEGKFEWTTECQKAFETIKDVLCTQPIY